MRSNHCFSRADKFEDVFEGSYPKNNQILRVIEMAQLGKEVPLAEVKARYAQHFSQLSKSNENMKRYTLVNCWHMNEIESAAMWKLYSHSNETITIHSTIDRLKNSFETTRSQSALIPLSGRGKLVFSAGSESIKPGESLLLPAKLRAWRIEPEQEMEIIRALVPIDLHEEIIVPLRAAGVPDDRICALGGYVRQNNLRPLLYAE